MEAKFINTERSEFSTPVAKPSQSVRVVYASWHPDQLTLSIKWIRQFKERIEGFEDDHYGVPIRSSIRDEPGAAGDRNVATRDAVDTATLGETTDFVAVLTAHYFSVHRNAKVSELSWVLETIEAKRQSIVVWIAVLEPHLDLKRRLANRDLRTFTLWHSLKDELLAPFGFYSETDVQSLADFAGELNGAIQRLRQHGSECSVCSAPGVA